MIPKKRKVSIQSIPKKPGKSRKLPHFLVKTYAREEGVACFGVIVSKKISKKAVERNVLKRKIYQSLRSFLSLKSPLDVVILALAGSEKLTQLEIKEELRQVLKTL